MKFFLQRSVKLKLAVTFTVLIGAISLFVFLYFPVEIARHKTEAIINKAESITGMTAYSVSAALLFEDHAAVEEALKSARQNKDLAYVAVLDTLNRVFTTFSIDSLHRHIFSNKTPINALAHDGSIYETAKPILHNGNRIGTLYLGISLHELNEEIDKSRATIAGVSLLLFIAGMVLVLGISTFITKPLSNMVETVRQITKGDLTKRTVVSSQDELGHLAVSFNSMVDNLEAAHHELENINRNLEYSVEERTRELQQEIIVRRRAEEDVRSSEDELRALFAAMTDVILVLDAEGRCLKIAPTNETLLLRPPDQLVGKSLHAVFAQHQADLFIVNIEKALKENRPVTLESNIDINGRETWFTVIISPMSKDTVMVVARDITERKRSEQQIREQAALLNVTRDAVMLKDLQNRVQFWNKSAEELYEWTEEEALNNNIDELLLMKQSEPAFQEACRDILEKEVWTGELYHVTKKGKEIIVESRWTLVKDDAGNPTSILVINSDITENKHLESKFRRAQRLEIIGTLAGGIAHDLNNILAPSLMAITLLQSKLTDEKSAQWLQMLETSTKRGAEIVKQVLSFARGVEGERVVLQPKYLLTEVEKITSQTFPRGIQIQLRIPKNLWTISGDATQLHQVLMNLCVNARDAMPRGGILTLGVENVEVDEQTVRMHLGAKPGQYVALYVSDTGTGIPPEITDKIFDPFFTTKEVGKGTGLGLPTVLTIARSHGGFTTLKSEIGRGTTFKVFIPASDSAIIHREKDSDTESENGNGETVLLVDDEASIREITKALLESSGYRVLLANNGTDAIVQYEKYRAGISVVLTDMMMPQMDGHTLIHVLKRVNPNVKIIAATGLPDSERNVSELHSSNVKAFLTKPYKAENLLRVLKTVLQSDVENSTMEKIPMPRWN